MKFIRKGGAPHTYSTWCGNVAGTAKADYRELPKNLKAKVLASLLAEQGWLCAYTMKRLEPDTSHIEHIKPESLCRAEQPESDLDYENLVACFPADGMKRKYRYGAQEKDDWWENHGREFISPLHQSCESRFCFDIEGNISAANGFHAAMRTIKILGLDHPTLTEDRRNVIEEFIYGEHGDDPLSRTRAIGAITTICQRTADRGFHEFCIPIRGALAEHVKTIRKLARKRSFARMAH